MILLSSYLLGEGQRGLRGPDSNATVPDPEDPSHPPRPLAPSTRPSEPARVRNIRVSGFSFPRSICGLYHIHSTLWAQKVGCPTLGFSALICGYEVSPQEQL